MNANIARPVRNEAKRKRTTPKTSPGRITATIAFPTLPAFRPPTNPAISGPKIGSQNNRTESTNIQRIALPTLPRCSAMQSVSHAEGRVQVQCCRVRPLTQDTSVAVAFAPGLTRKGSLQGFDGIVELRVATKIISAELSAKAEPSKPP